MIRHNFDGDFKGEWKLGSIKVIGNSLTSTEAATIIRGFHHQMYEAMGHEGSCSSGFRDGFKGVKRTYWKNHV